MADLYHSVVRRRSINYLRSTFTPDMVRNYFASCLDDKKKEFLFPSNNTTWHWLFDYLHWFHDECKIPLDCQVYAWGEMEYPLDYCLHYFIAEKVLEFYITRNAPTIRGLDYYLRIYAVVIPFAQRLLDAGAKPTELPKDHNLTTYYRIRQETRAAILAFLAARRRRPDLRQKVAREIWQEIARLIWERRWDFFVGTRRERRYKIK